MDMELIEVISVDDMLDDLEKLLDELELEVQENYSAPLETNKAQGIVPREAAMSETFGLTDELIFFDNLNSDYHLYKESLPEGEEPTQEGFIAHLRDELKWSEVDLEYLQTIAAELEGALGPGTGLIDDIQYAHELSTLLNVFIDAVKDGDVVAEVRADGAVRTLYHD